MDSNQGAILFGEDILRHISMGQYTYLEWTGNGDNPIFVKFKHITREAAIISYRETNDQMPQDQQIKDYLLDPSSEDKFMMIMLPKERARIQELKSSNAAMQQSITNIDKEFKSDYSRLEKLVKDPKASPYEVSMLQEKVAGRLPPMTDEQLCDHFREQGIKKEDNKQYRLAYQRMHAKKTRSKKNATPPPTVSNSPVQTVAQIPTVVIPPMGHMMNQLSSKLPKVIDQPAPVVELVEIDKFEAYNVTKFAIPMFELEVIPPTDDQFVEDMYTKTTGKGQRPTGLEHKRLKYIYRKIYDIRPDLVTSDQMFTMERIQQTLDFFGMLVVTKKDPLYQIEFRKKKKERNHLERIGLDPDNPDRNGELSIQPVAPVIPLILNNPHAIVTPMPKPKCVTQQEDPFTPSEWNDLYRAYLEIYDICPGDRTKDQNIELARIGKLYREAGKKIPYTEPKYQREKTRRMQEMIPLAVFPV